MRMRQETFKKSYYIPAFGKSIEIRRNQDIDEEGVLGKELLAQYGEDCILEGETKSLMEKVASGDIGGGGSSLTTEQTAAIAKIEGLEASASEINGLCTVNQNTLDIDGDSIASANGLGVDAVGSVCWGLWFLGQRLQLIKNFGVGGQRTDNILDRLSITLASTSKFIHFIVGKNDVIQDKLYDDIILNLASIYTQTIKAGKIVIASTIIPSTSDTATQKALILKLNRWITAQQSNYKNFIVVDYYSAIVDFSTGLAKVGYLTDGTHPSVKGGYYMGIKFKEALSSFLPETNVFQNNNVVDSFQILPNSLMINGATLATNWSGNDATFTKEILSNGNHLQVITQSDSTKTNYFYQNLYTGWIEGDVISGYCKFEVSSVALMSSIAVNITIRSASTILSTQNGIQISASSKPMPSETFTVVVKIPKFTIPVGTVRLIPYFVTEIQGVVKLDKFQIFNHGQA